MLVSRIALIALFLLPRAVVGGQEERTGRRVIEETFQQMKPRWFGGEEKTDSLKRGCCCEYSLSRLVAAIINEAATG